MMKSSKSIKESSSKDDKKESSTTSKELLKDLKNTVTKINKYCVSIKKKVDLTHEEMNINKKKIEQFEELLLLNNQMLTDINLKLDLIISSNEVETTVDLDTSNLKALPSNPEIKKKNIMTFFKDVYKNEDARHKIYEIIPEDEVNKFINSKPVQDKISKKKNEKDKMVTITTCLYNKFFGSQSDDKALAAENKKKLAAFKQAYENDQLMMDIKENTLEKEEVENEDLKSIKDIEEQDNSESEDEKSD